MQRAPRIAAVVAFLLAAGGIVASPPASAAQYERTILIDTELDLYELQLNGEISTETLETLVELFRVGLDLNTAPRDDIYVLPGVTYPVADAIIKYREAAGGMKDPAQLVVAGIVPKDVMEQMAPFLVVGRAYPIETRNAGSVRLMANYTLTDPVPPATMLQGRFKGLGNFSAGFAATLNRQRLGQLQYDDTAGAVVADMPIVQPNLPRLFAQWDSPELKVVGGTFRLGFGQRLTLDNTSRLAPDGIYGDDQILTSQDLGRWCRQSGAGEITDPNHPCYGRSDAFPTEEKYNRYITPDFRWNDVFRGLAVQLKNVKFGDMQLKAAAFGSYQSYNIYQYYLYDKANCTDPRDAKDSGCSSPRILAPVNDQFGVQPSWSFLTLPNVVDELAGGGNVTLSFLGRGRVGLTGYGATPFFRVPGVELGYKPASGMPFNGPFGAIGVDAAWGRDWVDFFIEVARSFDSMPRELNGREVQGGGGFGVLQRTTMGLAEGQEMEVSLRYYDRNFINPYARPISGSDEVLGVRATNEAGGRVRYNGKPLDVLALRAWADLYTWPGDSLVPGTQFRTNFELYGRADWKPIKPLETSLWLQHRNLDLSRNGPGEFELNGNTFRNCFDRTASFDSETGMRIPCAGEQFRVGVRGEWSFSKELWVAAQYQHELQVDVGSAVASGGQSFWRQDANANVEAGWRPSKDLRMRFFTRYLDDATGIAPNEADTGDSGASLDAYKERSLWSYLDVTWQPIAGWLVRGRYDLKWWLDARETTGQRVPNPENRFRLEVEARF